MSRRKIVLAVTIDDSLQFLKGYPAHLVDQGWEVHVVSNAGPRLSLLAQQPHVHTYPLHMKREPHLVHDLRSLWRWIAVLHRIQPDAVSVGTPKAGLLGSIAALLTNVPVRVYMLRGLRLETSRGVRRLLLLLAERMTMWCATHVLSISPSLRARSVELGLAPSAKIRVLGRGSSNGTDTAEFDSSRFTRRELDDARSEIGLAADLPLVGYVGRLTRDKGLFVLADALEELASRGVRCQLIVVGGVDDKTGQDALIRLRSLPVPVAVTGHVASPALHYALMDVLALPSYREGFGNVVIEASSSGIPVVVSDATGVVDAVLRGQTGLVAGVGDPIALADNLQTLILDPRLAEEMGENGRRWVTTHFDRQVVQGLYASDLADLTGSLGSK
ncbi:MAG TPA: glycosyltransferase family 4 protein [Glaciibacter sp.]|nr:glycosyltransferase family 4 protein [Glaciibacter sp.]